MKYIYFIRHAKAQKENYEQDLQRELSSSGKDDLKTMIYRIKDLEFKAQSIISSPARRCIKTAQKLCKSFSLKEKDIKIEKNFYDGNLEDVLNFIKELKESRVVLIMHNPLLQELCEYLAHIDLENFPTSAILCMQFDIKEFKDIKEHSGEVVFFDYPKSQENH
ncbi:MULTISPECIES: SixA phosphatase family protein [unclassified Campylobacter]|uniref:SixA phosphatase family protein n=1 Tax=unclassified Campylobacter TaxID=2593542 RepID=UPI0021E6C455|nr:MULTISPECIES: histidine phosphatase family protein [unclassified Campylobacter]EGK8010760.1 histidine phosphatase family protein [Campylobacter lari]MCV3396981.1 histidine phosphatase family protein [Campylobacter sp. RKI_CA19_01116]MCV3482270.1 histidine phosphatase family protein [Campylobacter sp. CNRCH_2014_0184h]HEC1752070.1 histidine phosphatase family protein [Campylobacter lari]HEC1776296.1 histidine phosphatase family protein [Campylobacter lari]